MAVSHTLLAWLDLQLSYLGMLKTLSPTDHLAGLVILALFLWTTASIVFALKTRHRDQTDQLSSCDTPIVGSDIVKTPDLHTRLQRPLTILDRNKRIKNKEAPKNHQRLGWKLAVTMIIAIPCTLLLLGYARLIAALHDGSWAPKRSTETASSTGLQEVFEVYQPVSLASHGTSGCDLDMVLMDHVFAYSYGAPFVGENLCSGWLFKFALTLGNSQASTSHLAVNSIPFGSILQCLPVVGSMTAWLSCT